MRRGFGWRLWLMAHVELAVARVRRQWDDLLTGRRHYGP